ncbi:MAG: ferrochelatase [Flexibacteraceae bacterium]
MIPQNSPIGILLVNLGTPDADTVPAVRRYLREFLMDGRVIDIPALPRFLLVNGIIAPFRAPKSTKTYKMVWLPDGSPLKVYGLGLEKEVQKAMGDKYMVRLAMRYQNPSMAKILNEMRDAGVGHILVMPLFPQYASATTGSVMQELMDIIGKWQAIPEITIINKFWEHKSFINSFAVLGKKYLEEKQWDHILFSYHGLPERHIRKGDDYGVCKLGSCCDSIGPANKLCYRAQCFATSRALAAALGIPQEMYTVCFQSRLGSDPWVKPYTEDIVKKLPKEGKKKVLVFSPAFVADCLETTEEIGEEYKEVFMEHGGEEWQLVESLNVSPTWVKAVVEMIHERLPEVLMA